MRVVSLNVADIVHIVLITLSVHAVMTTDGAYVSWTVVVLR